MNWLSLSSERPQMRSTPLLQFERLESRSLLAADAFEMPAVAANASMGSEIAAEFSTVVAGATAEDFSQNAVQSYRVLVDNVVFDGEPYDAVSILDEQGNMVDTAVTLTFFDADDTTLEEPLSSAPSGIGDYLLIAHVANNAGDIVFESEPIAFRILAGGIASPPVELDANIATPNSLDPLGVNNVFAAPLLSEIERFPLSQSMFDLFNGAPLNREVNGLSLRSELTIELELDRASIEDDEIGNERAALFDDSDDEEPSEIRLLDDVFRLGGDVTESTPLVENTGESRSSQLRGRRR